MLEGLICKEENIILDAMEKMFNNKQGVVFIVNDKGQLKGILTEEKTRDYLLSGGKLQSPLKNAMIRGFDFIWDNEGNGTIQNQSNIELKVKPIINKNYNIVDLDMGSNRSLPVASPNLNLRELKYVMDAFLSTWISSTGKYISLFEERFSGFCGSKYGVAVSNGTVALHIALEALEVRKGDEVIVPDLTFAATINAVLHAGATPVIVDIDTNSWCIDPLEIEKAITPKTKAIIAVHIYGQPCEMDNIMEIANKYNIYVIEDCAEAHGSKYKGKTVGSIGHVGCFSFFGNKIITTGEGGMCVTNSQALRDRLLVLRDHGMSKTKAYWHDVVGFNYRMTNIQAAIGVAQMERITELLSRRQEIEAMYIKHLSELEFIEFPKNLPERERVVWMVSLLIKNGKRDNYIAALKRKNIDTRRFFFPLSEMSLYKQYTFSNKNSTLIAEKGINLPTLFDITEEDIKRIRDIFRGKSNV